MNLFLAEFCFVWQIRRSHGIYHYTTSARTEFRGFCTDSKYRTLSQIRYDKLEGIALSSQYVNCFDFLNEFSLQIQFPISTGKISWANGTRSHDISRLPKHCRSASRSNMSAVQMAESTQTMKIPIDCEFFLKIRLNFFWSQPISMCPQHRSPANRYRSNECYR